MGGPRVLEVSRRTGAMPVLPTPHVSRSASGGTSASQSRVGGAGRSWAARRPTTWVPGAALALWRPQSRPYAWARHAMTPRGRPDPGAAASCGPRLRPWSARPWAFRESVARVAGRGLLQRLAGLAETDAIGDGLYPAHRSLLYRCGHSVSRRTGGRCAVLVAETWPLRAGPPHPGAQVWRDLRRVAPHPRGSGDRARADEMRGHGRGRPRSRVGHRGCRRTAPRCAPSVRPLPRRAQRRPRRRPLA